MKEQICRLRGSVQHYAWGGLSFIPALINQPNPDKKPFAEYWLGAHPSASSYVELPDGTTAFLHHAIEHLPFKYIGKEVYNRFKGLPYLLKVLDVYEMLSIQVHPSKEEAEKGFAQEEAAGISINAPHRNYKDKNHKPEVMVALSDFWLLHGFKKEQLLNETLQAVPTFTALQKIFTAGGYKELYRHVMEMPQQEADELLRPLVEAALSGTSDRKEPAFWVRKLYAGAMPSSNFDRGIFSIYFFNIVHLQKGQAIFQGAGVPHAYLEGQNVELMANSDNVLRGGLTPKHIDVPELLKHIHFEGIEPNILSGEQNGQFEINFPLPTEEFGISIITLTAGASYSSATYSAEIFLVMGGEVIIEGKLFVRGEAFVALANKKYMITTSSEATVYKAFVPQPVL